MKENFGDLALILFFLAGVGGWIANIVKLIGAYHFGGMEIARAIGIIVAPLGAVLGYV